MLPPQRFYSFSSYRQQFFGAWWFIFFVATKILQSTNLESLDPGIEEFSSYAKFFQRLHGAPCLDNKTQCNMLRRILIASFFPLLAFSCCNDSLENTCSTPATLR